MKDKKEARQSIDWRQISFLIAGLMAVLVMAIAVLTYQPYVFSLVDTKTSTVFYSNDFPVPVHLARFADAGVFLVAVELRENEGMANPYLANAASLFSVVFIGNEKNVTSLYLLFNENNGLQSCRTNLGDVLTDAALSKEECESFLNDFSGATVYIAWPNAQLVQNQAVLDSDTLRIQTNDFESLGNTAFAVLQKMFDNSQDILDSVNDLAGRVG